MGAKRRAFAMVVVMMACWALTGLVAAAGTGVAPVGDDFRIARATATDGSAWDESPNSYVAYNPNGEEFLVVWKDGRRKGGRGYDIYGQRFSATGSRLGFNFRISGRVATADEFEPAAVFNPVSNEYLVVWQDSRTWDATQGWTIYGQRLSATGKRLGGSFSVSRAKAPGSDREPAVAYDPTANNYLVVFSRSMGVNYPRANVYGQRIAATGTRMGANFRINRGPSMEGENSWPAVAYSDAAKSYLVVWSDTRNADIRGRDVFGQRLSEQGERLGKAFRVSGKMATSTDYHCAVAYNRSNRQFLVVWTDDRNYETRGEDIYGQRVSSAGSRLAPNFRISGNAATGEERHPSVAHDTTANQYLVVWGQRLGSADEVYGQRIKAGGARIGGNILISDSAHWYQWQPALAYGSAPDRYLVAWKDHRDDATWGYDIYGQWLDF